MSQIKFDKPLQINLSPSVYTCLYVKLVHGLALVVLLLPYNISFWVRIILLLIIVLSLLRTMKNMQQRYIGQLRLTNENQWLWVTNKNNEQRLVFTSGAIITSKLVVLNFIAATGKKVSWCFFPDSGNDELFRQLRIYLRYSTADTGSEIV